MSNDDYSTPNDVREAESLPDGPSDGDILQVLIIRTVFLALGILALGSAVHDGSLVGGAIGGIMLVLYEVFPDAN